MARNRLLVVDDEPDVGAFIARVADRCGYEVLVTSTPDKFLEHVRTWDPTHIVMDLKMPNIDGIELLSHLAAASCKAGILLISGADRSVVDTARRIGIERGLKVEGVLPKPIRVPDLRAALEFAKGDDEWPTFDAISQGLDRQEFVLVYQPKIDLKTRHLVGFEALVRWEHPTRGTVLPENFIPIVESSPSIDRLTAVLMAAACRQLKQWHAAGLNVGLSINISARNLHNGRFVDVLEGLCREFGVAPEHLVLELTETATMRDTLQVMDVLGRMRLKGFQLAIDDFGTGYSSLVRLHRLPFSELKIDRSFIGDCTSSPESLSIVKLVIGLAHALNVTAVAEGVQSGEALDLLTELGCDQAQGFHIAPPMRATDVLAWAQARPTTIFAWDRPGTVSDVA